MCFSKCIYIYLTSSVKKTFFLSKPISKVANIKPKSATIAIFSSILPPCCFFFSAFPFPSLSVIFELIERKKPAFYPFVIQIAAHFVRFVFKKSARYKLLVFSSILTHEFSTYFEEFSSCLPKSPLLLKRTFGASTLSSIPSRHRWSL